MRAFRQFVLLHGCLCVALSAFTGHASAQTAGSRVVGTVKSISGTSVVVRLDNGADATVTFADSARIVRAAPGQADLKSAVPIQVADIQVGDRISLHVQSGDNNALLATSALVMAKGDIAQKQQHEREEWRKGVGGIVKSIDASSGTITIPNSLAGAGKQIVIHVSPQTEVRRYSPDSVRFEDAKASTLDQVKVGDQVRARGTKNEDGSEFTAQAIVSGSFREMAATVISTDAASNSITVTDLATKKPITIMIGPNSMLRKLPQMMAMGIAMRLKGVTNPGGARAGGGEPAASGASGGNGAAAGEGTHARYQGAGGQTGSQGQAGGERAGGPGGGSGSGGFRGGNGPPDFQQILARMPPMQLTELGKGDAVLLVATEGSSGAGPIAITLLAGVEPILTATPPGMNAAATVLSPWNLGTGGVGGGDASVGQ